MNTSAKKLVLAGKLLIEISIIEDQSTGKLLPIVTDGFPKLQAKSILERRQYAKGIVSIFR